MDKESFFSTVSEFAKAHNMTCELEPFGLIGKGDYSVCVDYKFSVDLYILHRSEIYHVREREDRKVNYWSETIHNGHHHVSGPGYRGYIGEQKPITLDALCERFLKELKDSVRFYHPEK